MIIISKEIGASFTLLFSLFNEANGDSLDSLARARCLGSKMVPVRHSLPVALPHISGLRMEGVIVQKSAINKKRKMFIDY